MVFPRRVVDAVADLFEQVEILSPEIEARVGPAEIEASILAELTFGVLAVVPLAIDHGRDRSKSDGLGADFQPPCDPRFLVVCRESDGWFAAAAREGLERELRFAAGDHDSVD